MKLQAEALLPVQSGCMTESKSVFCTTLWTTVLTARSTDKDAAGQALERLCQIYWRPVHAFIRRGGARPHDAEDLTQEFFATLLQKDILKRVEREKGKFRTFLLAALTNFLHNDWDKQRRLKRGGNYQIISLADAEAGYSERPSDDLTPERLFDRRWAFDLIEHVRRRLLEEYAEAGKPGVFQKLEPHLTQELTAQTRCQLAAVLNMNEGTVKIALHRLRRRFGEALRGEIAQTVATREEIDQEIRHLFATIST
jgi:RNA polymerase sigma factor (sigma-70 family)